MTLSDVRPATGRKVIPPTYLRIADTIGERLSSGVYRAGSRLPSESQFCAEFAVSPMTLRRALMVLTDRGLISAEKGRGTFARSFGLSDSVFTVEQLMGGWLEESAEVRLLSASTTPANARVAAMLEISPGGRVVHLRRLVLNDRTPVVYHTEYVIFDPRRPLVESQLRLTSWRGVLEAERGQGFPRGEVTLGAVALDAEAAKVLGERPGTPALCMEHLFRDADRTPVGWGCFLLRSDLFRLRARLGPE